MDRRKTWQKVFDRLFPYKGQDSFFERKLGEHFSIRHSFVIYGWNAMHVAVNIHTRWGWLCFHPTFRVFGKWWPGYLYLSPDATPYNCRFKLGRSY